MPRHPSRPTPAQGAFSNDATDQREDFQSLILEHSRNPRHFGTLADANRTGEADNPVCGDRFRIFLNLKANRIEAIRFRGTGCAISMASASMMTEVVEHQLAREAESLVARFRQLLAGESNAVADAALGDLISLSGVRAFPLRTHCATLPWQALLDALHGDPNPVSNE